MPDTLFFLLKLAAVVRDGSGMGLARRFLILVMAVALLAACQSSGDNTVINITTTQADETATVTIEDGRALIDVTSPRGIGGLTATLDAGQWPEAIVVRLHLRGLEQLEIAYDAYTLTTGKSSNSNPDPALELTVVEEDGTVQTASPSADMWYPTIVAGGADGQETIPLPEGGYFDITLPPHFSQGDYRSFRMRWVDFFR
jgi:hypothetical protein